MENPETPGNPENFNPECPRGKPPTVKPNPDPEPRPRIAATPDPETPTPNLADPGETQPRHAKKFYDEFEQNEK